MSRRLREIAEPFVAAPPAGARVRTRLRVSEQDEAVLWAAGRHLGSLAGRDLSARCAEGRLDAKGRSDSRRERKRALTAASSSRWAGAITRTSEDAWQLASRNLEAERASLKARVRRIEARIAVQAGEKNGRAHGYATPAERHAKTIRLKALKARLARAEQRTGAGSVSVARGGRRLMRARLSLEEAGLTEDRWREEWEASRLFLTADGEAAKPWGNETIRVNPDEGWLELKLPAPLAGLANRPSGRYRLACPAEFSYRADEVAAQAASGAVRYDISTDPETGRWYCDASWKKAPAPAATLEELQAGTVVAVDVNAGHLDAAVITTDGNVLGTPFTVPLDLAGLAAPTRDGRLRAAVTALITAAKQHGARAVVIENLDFGQARAEGRERAGSRPSRGGRGRGYRKMVARHPHRQVQGPPYANGVERGPFGDRDRPGLLLALGGRSLAAPAARAAPRDDRPPRRSAGDRTARPWPPGQDPREREPDRPRGRGTASPDADPETPASQALTKETRSPTRPTAAKRR